MASLIEKDSSGFLYLAVRDPKTGRRKQFSTGYRRDVPADVKKARALRAQWEAKELAAPRSAPGEEWAGWVPEFLRVKYSADYRWDDPNACTLKRAQNAWTALSAYLREIGVRSARHLTRKQLQAYP